MTEVAIRSATLAAVVLLAFAAPAYLLTRPAPQPLDEAPVASQPIVPQPVPELDSVRSRRLFAAGDGPVVAEKEPDGRDGPQLVGIAGRLGKDAVVLVRGTDGGTVTLSIGESSAGWRLDSIARDAVLFSRGAQRKRIDLTDGA